MKGTILAAMAMALHASAALPVTQELAAARLSPSVIGSVTPSAAAFPVNRGTTTPRAAGRREGVALHESFADVVTDTTPPISQHECIIHMTAERAALGGAARWVDLAGLNVNTNPLTAGMQW